MTLSDLLRISCDGRLQMLILDLSDDAPYPGTTTWVDVPRQEHQWKHFDGAKVCETCGYAERANK